MMVLRLIIGKNVSSGSYFGVRVPCGAVESRHQIGGAHYGHDQLQRAGIEAELNLYPATNAVLLVLVVVVVLLVLLLLLLGSSRSRCQSIWVSEVRGIVPDAVQVRRSRRRHQDAWLVSPIVALCGITSERG